MIIYKHLYISTNFTDLPHNDFLPFSIVRNYISKNFSTTSDQLPNLYLNLFKLCPPFLVPSFLDNFASNLYNNRPSISTQIQHAPSNIKTTPSVSVPATEAQKDYTDIKDLQEESYITKSFSFISLNIRSLNKNCGKINQLLLDLSFKPSIIGVSETWLNKKNYFLHDITGYKFVQQNSLYRSGGTAFFIKEDIDYEIVTEYNIKVEKCENVWINCTLQKNKSILIGMFYRHHDNDFNLFAQEFEALMDKLNTRNKVYLIGGDFNFDLNKNSDKVFNYIEMLRSYGCLQTVKKPTRFSGTCSPSLLDHFYTNIPQMDFHTKILLSDISDHLPLLGVYSVNLMKSCRNRTAVIRDYRNFDIEHFLPALKGSMDNLFLESFSLNANSLCNKFTETYEALINDHAPTKTISRKKLKLRQKPWIDNSILKLIRKKNLIFNKYIKTKSQIIYHDYKKLRNQVTRTVEQAKRKYYEKLFSSSSSNSKKLWKNINNLLKHKRSKDESSINEIMNRKGEIITDHSEIANVFNNFFVNIGEELANKISTTANNPMSNLIKPTKNSIFISPITANEIKQIIDGLDVTKSTPSHSATIWLVKASAPVICSVLAKIFNQCINEGVFPDIFKVAEVIPMFKAGDKKNPGNYRPISLLNVFSKIFERCLHNRLESYLTSYNLFYECQFGFRHNSSTENAVTQIHHQLSRLINDKQIVCSIFLDLRKAFDCVDHNILMEKLFKYGIRGNAHRLISSFLTNRKQYTIIQGKHSRSKEIKFGVPQGSILGPLLFLLYVNDFNLSTTFTTNLFADDTYLSLHNRSPTILEQEVNIQLDRVNLWLRENKLTLNTEKSTYLILSNRLKSVQKLTVRIGNEVLKESSEAKYLGIIIDNKLSFIPHIKNIKKKLSSTCWALSRLKNYLDSETLKKIYYALIYPHISYCITSWGASPHVQDLFLYQKRAARIIDNQSFYAPSSPIFLKYNILKIQDIYNLQIGLLMFKINKNLWLGKLNYINIKSIHNYNTRQSASENYYRPSISTNTAKYCSDFMWLTVSLSSN